jgi:hypothetical protein
MEERMYDPRPDKNVDIAIPAELEPLVEQLAEHAHDSWARTRLDEGWTFGPARDDRAKKHPCLVPYAELPESERFVDRRLISDTLKLILSLGYAIERSSGEPRP